MARGTILAINLVRPPGFEPGSLAWKANILPGWTTAAAS